MSLLSNNGKRLTPGAYPLAIGALLLSVSQAAMSHDINEGKWLVRVMALDIRQTNVRSEVPDIGGKIDIAPIIQPGLDISYFVTDHWAVEFQGGIAKNDYRIAGSAIGDFDIGSVETLSLGLTLQYHFRPTPNLKPYLGVGLIHTRTRAVKPADNIPDFDVEDINSVVLNAGVDYRLSGNWFASASLRYILIPTYRAKGEAFDTEVKLNALVSGIGVGYRF